MIASALAGDTSSQLERFSTALNRAGIPMGFDF
jgi:hypothetical protein